MNRNRLLLLFAIVVLFLSTALQAQFQDGSQSADLNLPLISQKAVTSQRIGITDITISYHRPLVNGRQQLWGKVIPYGKVWRAGANENTTIEFTDPVTIEGKPLAKGIYGLHMIPGENEWTIIFSKNSTAWGSFTYNQAEDALRVTVKPQASDFREALLYDFDALKPDSSVVTLRWEKLVVPFRVAVNANEITARSLPDQLRGLSGFGWNAWDDAAKYLLENKGNLDDALKYADRSIQNEERFDNLLTKSRVLEAQGKKDDAAGQRAKALEKANAVQTHVYARQLQNQGQQPQALEIFRQNAKKHPDEWIVHAGMARVYSAQADFTNAAKEMKTAMAGAPAVAKPNLESLIKRLEAKDDINK